jgi:hypothetical protein
MPISGVWAEAEASADDELHDEMSSSLYIFGAIEQHHYRSSSTGQDWPGRQPMPPMALWMVRAR